MTSKNVEYLKENGPATSDELPNTKVHPNDRINGVWGFGPSLSNKTHFSGAGKTISIYYIKDYHRERDVIVKWIESNDLKQKLNRQQLSHAINQVGQPFDNISAEVLDIMGIEP